MQGFNMGRYVPPDQEGVISGNALNKKHPLGARAAKLASQGVLTVRFEMPFAVWCGHCPAPTIIGQGVRFNAAKRRVGSYHSTPVWAFTLRHAACGGEIEVRTDPQHTAYVVAAGGRRRDTGADDESLVSAVGDGGFAIRTDAERAQQRESAFGNLEKTIADREKLLEAGERLGELQDAAARLWDDPYAQNQRLRKAFRVGRHEREKEAVKTENLQDRMSLGIELLPGSEADARHAALIDFGGADVDSDLPVEKALARPLFKSVAAQTGKARQGKNETGGKTTGTKRKLKSEIAAEKRRENLVSEIIGNTRATLDPFLDFGSKETPKRSVIIPGLKKRRTAKDVSAPGEPPLVGDEAGRAATPIASTSATPTPLVSYCSDSD
ncbi:CWC16 protein [Lasiosphaeria hispida]|uniref:CWC16 protein n=1 Tax=Lasiosphaeria hispida TaxID=260671 RepID=A0AAJ0HFR5_9PEZI|nr:CWC16 protein [Lasiosphaeria hispida]